MQYTYRRRSCEHPRVKAVTKFRLWRPQWLRPSRKFNKILGLGFEISNLIWEAYTNSTVGWRFGTHLSKLKNATPNQARFQGPPNGRKGGTKCNEGKREEEGRGTWKGWILVMDSDGYSRWISYSPVYESSTVQLQILDCSVAATFSFLWRNSSACPSVALLGTCTVIQHTESFVILNMKWPTIHYWAHSTGP